VQRTPLLKCYKVSFESNSTNILLSFQHHVVWCGALAPLVRSISTSVEDKAKDSLCSLHYMNKMLITNLCSLCSIDNRNRL